MNWLAVVVATVVNMALGALWFSPPVFGKKWLEWEGKTEMSGGGGPMIYVLTAIGALVSATALAWFIQQTGTNTLAGGALLGLYAGLGLVGPAMYVDHIFNGRRSGLYTIVAGYPIVALLIMGAILGAWR